MQVVQPPVSSGYNSNKAPQMTQGQQPRKMMLMETQRVTKANGFTIDISSKTTTAAAAPQDALNSLLRKSVAKANNPGGHHHGASMQQYSNNLMQGKQSSLNERGSTNS